MECFLHILKKAPNFGVIIYTRSLRVSTGTYELGNRKTLDFAFESRNIPTIWKTLSSHPFTPRANLGDETQNSDRRRRLGHPDDAQKSA